MIWRQNSPCRRQLSVAGIPPDIQQVESCIWPDLEYNFKRPYILGDSLNVYGTVINLIQRYINQVCLVKIWQHCDPLKKISCICCMLDQVFYFLYERMHKGGGLGSSAGDRKDFIFTLPLYI
jgi:hypothetical protein